MALARLNHLAKLREIRLFLFFLFLGLSVSFSVIYYALNMWMLSGGLASENLLYLGEKAQLAWHGKEPRISNTLFINPIIPYFFILLCRNPFLGSAIAGGMTLSFIIIIIIKMMHRGQISKETTLIILIYLICSPTFLLLFSQSIDVLATSMFLLLATYSLRRYYFEKVSGFLFIFSLCLGLLVINSRMQFAFLWILLPTLVVVNHSHHRPLGPIALAAYFPLLWFLFTPLILSKLYLGYANFSGLHDLPIYMKLKQINPQESLLSSTYYFINTVIKQLPLMIPYWLFWMRPREMVSPLVYITFLFVPLFYLWTKIYTGLYTTSPLLEIYFILFSLLLFAKSFGNPFENTLWKKLVAIICFIVSFVWTMYEPFDSNLEHEQNFSKMLFHKPYQQNITFAKDLGLELRNTEGQILTDDQTTFPVVYFTDQPWRYILPYQDEFKTIISSPKEFASYVIASKTPEYDQILKAFPEMLVGRLDGYKLIKENEDYVVYKRI